MSVIRLFDEERDRPEEGHVLDEIARRLERLEWPCAPPQLRERCWERFSEAYVRGALSAGREP